MNPNKKIKFKGEIYWLTPANIFNMGNLSPYDHFSEDGEMLADPFTDISYAIIEKDGNIVRYGQQIGDISELVYIE